MGETKFPGVGGIFDNDVFGGAPDDDTIDDMFAGKRQRDPTFAEQVRGKDRLRQRQNMLLIERFIDEWPDTVEYVRGAAGKVSRFARRFVPAWVMRTRAKAQKRAAETVGAVVGAAMTEAQKRGANMDRFFDLLGLAAMESVEAQKRAEHEVHEVDRWLDELEKQADALNASVNSTRVAYDPIFGKNVSLVQADHPLASEDVSDIVKNQQHVKIRYWVRDGELHDIWVVPIGIAQGTITANVLNAQGRDLDLNLSQGTLVTFMPQHIIEVAQQDTAQDKKDHRPRPKRGPDLIAVHAGCTAEQLQKAMGGMVLVRMRMGSKAHDVAVRLLDPGTRDISWGFLGEVISTPADAPPDEVMTENRIVFGTEHVVAIDKRDG